MEMERSNNIGIIEVGRVGVAALRALLDFGWRDFALADARTISVTDVLGDSIYQRCDVGQRRVDTVIEGLREQFPDARFELCAGPEQGPLWSADWLARCAVCLLSSDASTELGALGGNPVFLSARLT